MSTIIREYLHHIPETGQSRRTMSTATAGTTIALKGVGADKKIGEAITDFLRHTKTSKEAEKLAGIAKTQVFDFAEARWLKMFEDGGEQPAGPFKIVNVLGESVNFIVQDKSDGAELKYNAATDLKLLLGREASSAVETTTKFALDSDVLYERAACGFSTVGACLANQVDNMVRATVISRDQADRLFKSREATVIKPKFLERLPLLADRCNVQLKELLGAVGSAIVRFIR
jgi:hypothetical protein